jgi:N-hydroxyarylamine O-acetyltransferase
LGQERVVVKVERYLQRIGINETSQPDHEFLARLQLQHMLHIPFENLDIGRGKRLILGYDALYDKIVEDRRGGYCYELNGLFYWLLKQLGYSVSMLSARVHDPDGKVGAEFDHMTLLVELDRNYLTDVGFGDSFRRPIVFPDGEERDVSGYYMISKNPDLQGGYLLQRHGTDGWTAQYQFTDIPRKLSDFEEMNNYHQTSPDSHFTRDAVCTIATPTGRTSLSTKFLTITKDGGKEKIPVESIEDYYTFLKDYFNIEL